MTSEDRAAPQTEAGKALMRFMGWGPAWAKKVIAIEDEMEAHLSPPSVAAVAEDRPRWAHTAANDPAGLYDDNWEPRTDAGDRDRREAELRSLMDGAISAEIDRLWQIAYKYEQHGEGSIGLLVDMTNAIGGLDSLRALLAAPGQAGPPE